MNGYLSCLCPNIHSGRKQGISLSAVLFTECMLMECTRETDGLADVTVYSDRPARAGRISDEGWKWIFPHHTVALLAGLGVIDRYDNVLLSIQNSF